MKLLDVTDILIIVCSFVIWLVFPESFSLTFLMFIPILLFNFFSEEVVSLVMLLYTVTFLGLLVIVKGDLHFEESIYFTLPIFSYVTIKCYESIKRGI